MRHRIGSINTGLGNSSSCLLPNTFSENESLNEVAKLIFEDALELKPLKEYGGFDFKVEVKNHNISIDFGFELAYQYDKLLIYHIENIKNNCNMIEGVAEGAYGSEIEITKDVEYKNSNIEFKELVDKWHDKILECI